MTQAKTNRAQGTEKLWTGRWLPDGSPELVSVPVTARANGGRGIGHYLAKGLKPVEAACLQRPEPARQTGKVGGAGQRKRGGSK